MLLILRIDDVHRRVRRVRRRRRLAGRAVSQPEQRERVLGYTQAFSSIGGLLVGVRLPGRQSLGQDCCRPIVMPEFL